MYSGSDSTESLQNQKWPKLNPVYPNNTPNDQIDWAALAQQWIIMKEAGPPMPAISPPTPPPPPTIHQNRKQSLSEGGEAPMEVENEKEDAGQSQFNNDMPATEDSWNWNQQQQWGYSWNAPVPPNVSSKAPLLPTPGSYNQYSSASPEASNFQYNNKPATTEYSGGYWTASNKSKPHNKRFSKVNVPPRHAAPPPAAAAAISDAITLDANRRKQLPAWIRDGLEKMERDKVKQLEKEKVKHENRDEEFKPKLNEKEALEIIKSTVKQRERSKFDSDGEDSGSDVKTRHKKRPEPEPIMISSEELMLRIRKTMTEILLKVTNQEILAVCKEEFQRRLRKHKASDHRVSASGGNNLSSKLGVGIYGESGSSADESDSDSNRDSVDSEAELKAVIRRRKAEFVKTERDIEERLAAAENHTDNRDVRAGTPDINQSQVDSKYQDYRIKLGNVGTADSPKYSSVKHTAGKALPSDSSESDSNSSDKRYDKIQNRKLSNSESSSNRKHARVLKRDDKSETPEKNVKHKPRLSTESHSKGRRSRSRDRYQDSRSTKQYLKRSRSRSSSRSYRSTESNSRRSDSYSKSNRSHKSRSRSRSRRRTSNSRERSSRLSSRKSGSRRRSRSNSPVGYYRRSRSRSSSRGKRLHRH